MKDPQYYLFKNISKPAKTWGKHRGSTAHGDFVGFKRSEWKESSNGECYTIYKIELKSGEDFVISQEEWIRARPATKYDLHRAGIKKLSSI